MKHLPLIFVIGLILSACTNDKDTIIININMIGEKADSIQNVINKSLKNDTAEVININIYNNYSTNSSVESIKTPTSISEEETNLTQAQIDSILNLYHVN